MTIRERSGGYQVEVNNAKALPKFRRIRKQINGSFAEAKRLETEIQDALETYRKWPIEGGDRPFVDPEATRKVGTLRLAAGIALHTHWAGTDWGKTVGICLNGIIRYFEEVCGVYDLDNITSDHLDAFVQDCRSRGNKPTTINKNLSMLSVVNSVALERKPPLCSGKLPIKKVRVTAETKWWLKPEKYEEVIKWLTEEKGDPIFADFISMMVRQGLRPMETLRLTPSSFSGMDTKKPWLQVPGTKTSEAGNAIPVYQRELVERCLKRANAMGWKTLFPYTRRQASDRWNEVRAYLGVSDIETATLRALRRTFAHYATTIHGMPTGTLQKVLRHRTITTTAGYLNLVGNDDVDGSRRYFDEEPEEGSGGQAFDIQNAIKAFKSTGATPEEVAKFTKEMMR